MHCVEPPQTVFQNQAPGLNFVELECGEVRPLMRKGRKKSSVVLNPNCAFVPAATKRGTRFRVSDSAGQDGFSSLSPIPDFIRESLLDEKLHQAARIEIEEHRITRSTAILKDCDRNILTL